jgi:hypothetical protein
MGGDFSRVRFQPGKHFAAVLLQQGRVQLDSDANEAESIREHRERMLVRDMFGPAAFVGGGFALSADGDRLTIGAGHAWIDGLLCELATDTDAAAQPDLPSTRSPDENGLHLAYLEVWQRQVSAAEDETLREPALGGPDTTVRQTNVAQVRFVRVAGDARRRKADWSVPTDTTDATLAVRGQYTGPDNQLYRIEIHDGSPRPTFKWSRNNGSSTAAVTAWTPTELVLVPGREPPFALGDDLEVVDRVSILERRPGRFVTVQSVDGDRLAITSSGEPLPPAQIDPLARRWDGGQPAPIETEPDHPIELEAGLELQFGGSTMRSGDYWLIAARTADGSVTWPDATDASDPQPPHGICIQRCALALLRREEGSWTVLRDLRPTIAGPVAATTGAAT